MYWMCYNISTLEDKGISTYFPFLNFMQKFLSFPLLRSYNHLKKKSADYWFTDLDTVRQIGDSV